MILYNGIVRLPVHPDSDPLVFTPLFLGASLYVPTADDIGTPGRLAEWMDKVKATVTHLTPGMPPF
jgi:L-2-aminoadipate reductase